MLSDYQRAVLTEIGVMSWQSQEKAKVGALSIKPNSFSEPNIQTTQVKALEKLSQLKQTEDRVSYTGQVVCLFDLHPPLPNLLLDILSVLGLEKLPRISLQNEQAKLAKDYALFWSVNSEKTEFSSARLMTPSLESLKVPLVKKQLWQLLQHITLQSN